MDWLEQQNDGDMGLPSILMYELYHRDSDITIVGVLGQT
jgi:hypothetical protein